MSVKPQSLPAKPSIVGEERPSIQGEEIRLQAEFTILEGSRPRPLYGVWWEGTITTRRSKKKDAAFPLLGEALQRAVKVPCAMPSDDKR